jgi:dipeptidyl aminopeptidase/acylaminoacyl peptidase
MEEKVSYGGAIWAKDGKGVYYTSDKNSEFKNLRYWDLKKKKSKVLTNNINWDVGQLSMSHNGRKLAFTVNEDGTETLYIMDVEDKEYEKVPGIPLGSIGGLDFHPEDKSIMITIATAKTTGDAYVLDLESYKLTRWTFSEIGGLNTASFASPKLFHYETFDEVDGKPREIPAFCYEPKGAQKPYPVLIYIHGGPEGQYAPYFSSLWSYTINEMGIAMIAPNVRGSNGYGKTYLKMDNGYKREDSVKDIGALIKWIKKQPQFDPERIAVYGGSYGGYMTYATMTNYNSEIRCAIDNVGISNFVTFLENTKEYRRDLRRVEYGDERDPDMREFLLKISPTTNAHKITKPIFIIQGLNDPRVPASEAEQMLAAVRKNGGDAWYLLAKDEGHGFKKKSNRDYMAYSLVMFLERFLLN